MSVFLATKLEAFTLTKEKDNWIWTPEGGEDVKELYASGAGTSTQESTYASEKDDRSDSDRPDEGLLVS